MLTALLINPETPNMSNPQAYPPLGLFYVWRVLEDTGEYDVRFWDRNIHRDPPPGSFDVYLLSVNIVQINDARQLIAEIRQRDSSAYVVLGGPMSPYLHEEVGSLGEDLLFIGEAEDGLVACLSRRERGTHRAGVPSQPMTLMPSCLPFDDYSAIDQGQRSASYLVSRGCPFRCAFCSKGVVRFETRRVRHTPEETILADLSGFRERGYTFVRVWDDIFGTDRRMAQAFLDAVTQLGMGFDCQLRSHMASHDWIARMQEAGCALIRFGFESFSQSTLNVIDKGSRLEHHIRAIEVCRDLEMPVRGLLIFGLPGETQETLDETFRIVDRYSLSSALSVFCPYPGTPVWDDPSRYDIDFDKREILKANDEIYYSRRSESVSCFVETSALSRQSILANYRRFEDSFAHLMKSEGAAEVVHA